MNLTHARPLSEAAVRAACQLCIDVRRDLCGPDTLDKNDKSPVTIADFGAQAVISDMLAEAFPDIPLVGEEDAAALREPEQEAVRNRVLEHVRVHLPKRSDDEILAAIDRGVYAGGPTGLHWTLDPIDGTKGFLRGDQYAVALALISDGKVVLGVLGCPNLPVDPVDPKVGAGCLFSAARGEGAVCIPLSREDDATPIQVTQVSDVTQAAFCESVESGHTSHGHAEKIAERLGVTAPPFRIDSQCKYAAIARGDASIYLRLPTRADYEEKIWDHAAGSIVVEEAGGTVTDVRGNPLDFSIGRTLKANKGVVATNGTLHDEVIADVRAVLEV